MAATSRNWTGVTLRMKVKMRWWVAPCLSVMRLMAWAGLDPDSRFAQSAIRGIVNHGVKYIAPTKRPPECF